jgi:hypothetical protein
MLQHHRDIVATAGRLVLLCDNASGPIEVEAHGDGGTVTNSTLLSTCSGDGGGGPGGDPGGSTWRCYTVTIDHYWYYPDTGRIEYRYTEEYSYCEQLS